MIHPVVCNPVLGPLVGVKDPVRWLAGRGYPSGAILHYDANLDPYTEQAGGPHTFNHAVLSPQYQRNADGSYTDVGAKPAVDVFGGKKWLRSCGAVTNLLPSGAEDFAGALWDKNSTGSIVTPGVIAPDGTNTAFLYYDNPNSNNSAWMLAQVRAATNKTVTISCWAKKALYNQLCFAIWDNVLGWTNKSNTFILTDEWQLYSYTATTDELSTTVMVGFNGGTVRDGIHIWRPQLTATSYPVPYTPPGTTMPASNATTTNGMWFSLPDGSPLWQALTGQPLTLATRVRMGVGSGDFTYDEKRPAISSSATAWYLQYFGNFVGTIRSCVAYDGTKLARIDGTWPRNSIINRVTQVSADGAQYRVGYMIEGTHTAIQWSAWVAYDGSFDPSTPYRLMLGFNSAYPMWFNKITAWKEQVSDALIMEAMS